MTDEQQNTWEEQRERDRIALTEGISEDALKVLKRHFRLNLPSFQFRENGQAIPGDGQTLALMAATRDGNREVVQYIEAMRALPPLEKKASKHFD